MDLGLEFQKTNLKIRLSISRQTARTFLSQTCPKHNLGLEIRKTNCWNKNLHLRNTRCANFQTKQTTLTFFRLKFAQKWILESEF